MVILGIDFGLKRIGLAFSEGGLVETLGVVENGASVFSQIADICRGKNIKKIVLGTPEGKMAKNAKTFGKILSQKTRCPVVFQDETLTTQDAIVKMIEAGKKKKYRREKQDAYAAALILQNYLDRLDR